MKSLVVSRRAAVSRAQGVCESDRHCRPLVPLWTCSSMDNCNGEMQCRVPLRVHGMVELLEFKNSGTVVQG